MDHDSLPSGATLSGIECSSTEQTLQRQAEPLKGGKEETIINKGPKLAGLTSEEIKPSWTKQRRGAGTEGEIKAGIRSRQTTLKAQHRD